MKRKKELICIACPLGCRLEARQEEDGSVTITGNRCKRGEEYGKEELLAPKRIVTATVALDSATLKRLPVKTDRALPKEHIGELLNRAYRLQLRPPITRGQIVVEDFRGTGVNLVASRPVE